MNSENTGVMLMAYGGPKSLDEVPAFLDAILGKGRLRQDQVQEIVERYRAIGGGSPLLSITRRQAEAVSRALAEGGYPMPVAVGMRYSEPTIFEALEGLVAEGCIRVLGCPMAPHASPASTEAYLKVLQQAAEAIEEPTDVELIEGWHASPAFLDAWAESVGEVLKAMGEGESSEAVVVFTAHSLPVSVAVGSPYEAQMQETVQGVLERFGPLEWKFAWQSQGIRGGEWLTPDIPETLSKVVSEGYKTVVFVPVGFVADHVETLYDIDIDARRMAEDMGLVFRRAESLNDRPQYIEALTQAILAAAEGR